MASCMECIHFNPCNSNKSIVVKKQTEGNEWELHNNVEGECKYFTHTADVVPKSDVFLASSDAMKMLIECHGYALTHDADIKKEVAREIFAEIEKSVEDAEFEFETFFGVKLAIAELKKKYTE